MKISSVHATQRLRAVAIAAGLILCAGGAARDAYAQGGLLLNISTRARVTEYEPLIAGFVVRAPNGETKRVIARGLGPSLTKRGVRDALEDPVFGFSSADYGIFDANNDWRDTNQGEIEATTLAPPDARDSAMVAALPAGEYTGILFGNDLFGTDPEGVALAEVFDLDPSSPARLINVSSRALVGVGDDVMIAGFVVGRGSLRVVLRAIGPTLPPEDETPMQDPTLELFDAQGNGIGFNDDWMQSQRAEIEATQFAPGDPRESAIVTTLPPGNYTAILRGKNLTTGRALVEVFVVQ